MPTQARQREKKAVAPWRGVGTVGEVALEGGGSREDRSTLSVWVRRDRKEKDGTESSGMPLHPALRSLPR